jgi:hypothetical protein
MEWHAPTACHCQNSQLFSNTAVLCAAILFDLDICKKKRRNSEFWVKDSYGLIGEIYFFGNLALND